MIDEKKIDSLLYSVPESVGYTTIPERLDLEDVPQERIDGLIELLSNENEVLQFDSARLLAHWGIDEGFDTLILVFEKGEAKGMIDYRLYGYDDTDRRVLSAFISRWTSEADQSQQEGDDARQKIFPPVARIIRKASSANFSVSELFWLVTKMQSIEYVPLVKECLQHIIDYPSKQYWEIHDTVKSLLKIESQFTHDLLESKHKKLSDFGL